MKKYLVLSGWCVTAIIAIYAWFEIDHNTKKVDELEEQNAILNNWIK